MNIIYVVTPLVLLAAFAGYAVPAGARLDAALATRAAAAEQRRADERRTHDEQHWRAADEQERRTAERIRLQAGKEREARAVQEKRDQTLSDNLVQARATREALRSEVSALEARLQQITVEHAGAGTMLHASRAALEARRIERRNADLELQRMTLLLAELVDASPALFPAPGAR